MSALFRRPELCQTFKGRVVRYVANDHVGFAFHEHVGDRSAVECHR
jgi:hypothetical protein